MRGKRAKALKLQGISRPGRKHGGFYEESPYNYSREDTLSITDRVRQNTRKVRLNAVRFDG